MSDVASERADPLLDEPVGGAEAVRELGARLPAAARVNELSATRLETLLRTDGTARLTTDGRLHYVEPIPADLPDDPPTRAVLDSAVALADTFALHSNPGAQRSIFLDFDGHTVAGTYWNSNYGVAAATHPGWDPSGDGAAFNATERAMVQQVWSMVSEDFAAYDVDVTTQDPGAAGLERSDSADQTYGTRALISPSSNAWSTVCQQQCGGVAFLNAYDAIGSALQPAWVFPQALGNSAKAIAEATSHEIGHNLALQHDGITGADYYAGHGSWAPIMGVGYNRPITQWSKGEYAGASTRQDDLAVIGGYLARRPDETGGLAPQNGYITSDTDSDVFALGRCSSGSTVAIASPYATPDLDVRARLLSPDGTVLATANPASGTVDATRAFGMDAALTVPTDARYSVEISGSGSGHQIGDTSTGYTAYGSIGAYQVTAAGCDRDLTGLPSNPTGLTEARPATTSTLSVSWSAPTASGASPITAYTVNAGTGAPLSLGPDTREATLVGLAAATAYDVTVTASNAHGPGVPASIRLRTAAAPIAVPSVPTSVSGFWNAAANRPELYWQPPSSDGGSPITGYALTVDGVSVGQVAADWSGVYFNGSFAAGDHTLTVAAVNAAGTGPAATSRFTVPSAPTDTQGPVTSDFDFTPKSIDVTNGSQQVTVSVRLTDATGAEAPTMTIDSDSTDQSYGFGTMNRVSGTAQDGRYERTVTLPTTAAAGTWTVTLFPTDDVLGNNGDSFRDHPQKLTVANTPTDTQGPVTSDFDFTPKSIDVTNGSQQVTVSVRLTDATGAEAPTMTIDSDPDPSPPVADDPDQPGGAAESPPRNTTPPF
ncbi:fibronectin type III domain-containing protein [Nocardioides sp. AX2bis]|uniref:fibronectin type III domain-containing protein n=1 Tax=Nocardioides sp. AX2bis TaxID=2653157 RepID=UPI0013567FC6|nr:fibronectin type III domain-containing protein [Nocardioides sp. AX2bis]